MIVTYKPLYMTMGLLTKKVKEQTQTTNLTFAGRLDPMAEGIVLFVAGADADLKRISLKLEKTYEAEVLLGVHTDTGDLLGLPKAHLIANPFNAGSIKSALRDLLGTYEWNYPRFSSKYIKSKTKKKTATRLMTFFSIDVEKISSTTLAAVLKKLENAKTIEGDFRQKRILTAWKKIGEPKSKFQLVKLTITCSSGSYIRVFAEHLGKLLGTQACLYSLKRTHVGNYSLQDVSVEVL